MTTEHEEKERKERFVNALTICCEKLSELVKKYNDMIDTLEDTFRVIVEVDFALREAPGWVIDAKGHCLSFDFNTVQRELLTFITDHSQKLTNAIISLENIRAILVEIKNKCCAGLNEAKRRLEIT